MLNYLHPLIVNNIVYYIVLTLVLRSSERNTYYLIFFYVAGYYLIRSENSRVLPYMESMYHPSPLYGAYRTRITGASMTHERLLVVTRHDVTMIFRLKMKAAQVKCYRRIEFKV